MHDATVSALRFVDGRSRQDLNADEMLLFALVRAVEVIGEAANKVSAAGRAELPDIRWAAIVGMRIDWCMPTPMLIETFFGRLCFMNCPG
jgi:uncharacterized protein with HEPN domain